MAGAVCRPVQPLPGAVTGTGSWRVPITGQAAAGPVSVSAGCLCDRTLCTRLRHFLQACPRGRDATSPRRSVICLGRAAVQPTAQAQLFRWLGIQFPSGPMCSSIRYCSQRGRLAVQGAIPAGLAAREAPLMVGGAPWRSWPLAVPDAPVLRRAGAPRLLTAPSPGGRGRRPG